MAQPPSLRSQLQELHHHSTELRTQLAALPLDAPHRAAIRAALAHLHRRYATLACAAARPPAEPALLERTYGA